MAYEDAIMLGSSFFLILLFYLSTKLTAGIKLMGRQTITVEIFQPVFIILGWVYTLFHFNIMIQIADANSATEIAGLLRAFYPGLTLMLTFFILYFIISFIYNLALSMNKRR